MTNKTTMPDPVAWIRRHPDGALTAEFLEEAVISTGRKQSGAWLPMITTTQAEAYANARVREAMEEAATVCWEMQSNPEYGKDDKDRWLAIAEQRIRALIPKEPPCET